MIEPSSPSESSKKRKIPFVVVHADTTEQKEAKQKQQSNRGNEKNNNVKNINNNNANSPRLLYQNSPEQKRRIQQRKRDIAYGKNTIGYDEYIKKIPKYQRKVNNMDTPMSPNPEVDISTRRWQGQVKAWRKALHKYDPPALAQQISPDIVAHGDNRKNNNMNVTSTNITNQLRLLNHNTPEEMRRIQQRKRDIAYGKSTIGYDEYIKKIPKYQRKSNNMDTPMTPNPEEDTPTRRWQGKVKAWRRSLHTYDPPNLAQQPSPDIVQTPELVFPRSWKEFEYPVLPPFEAMDYDNPEDENEIGQKHVIDFIEKMFCNG